MRRPFQRAALDGTRSSANKEGMKLPLSSEAPRGVVAGLAAAHIRTRDLDRSVRLWGTALGLPLVKTEPAPRRYFFLAGPSLIVLEETGEPPAAGPVTRVGVSVSNLEELEKLRQRLMANGHPVGGIEDEGHAYAFSFRDAGASLLIDASCPARPFSDSDLADPAPVPSARNLIGR
jgi:catechol 2,3-dioxygenase-like lactoylglutathione lyase family enzyme